MGIMGDFAGDPSEPLKPLAERKFVQIDRDNFNDVMARIQPGLNIKVDQHPGRRRQPDGREPEVQQPG
jgi:type VI secretion system protein ImpB